MQWYYAVGSERRGPVDTVTFSGLVNNGTITPTTLVWRTGMAEWQPWSSVAPSVEGELIPPGGAPAGGVGTVVETPWPGQPADSAVESLPMEALWARIKERGFNTSVGSCISRGWDALKTNYWGALGTTLLFMLLSVVAQQIPLLGLAAVFIVTPQLSAGIWWYFIRRSRGEEATVGHLFDGFKRGFGQLALIALLQMLLMIPFIGVMFGLIFASSQGAGAEPAPWVVAPVLIIGLAVAVVFIRWQFAHAIVIDRGYSATEALKLSWRIVGLRFWTLVGLGLVLSLIMMLGVLALFVGLIFVLPLMFSSMVQAYEDAVNPSE